jgi:cytochrome c biogenesis protein CcmG, thiol:disulfide interchange protein DsbE
VTLPIRWVFGLLGYACLLSVAAANTGSLLDLDSFRGRVVYLDFWASWCTPCRQSFPWMQGMKDVYEQQGLSVVAVNLDKHREDAEKFLLKFHPNFDVLFDPDGQMADRFKVSGMPTSVIIDRHGKQRYIHIGFLAADRGAYESELRGILAEK